ncbi:MAG TPA: hypothetical protein VK761_05180, partial [Solirubrobacteraceae bacterium]|nr:hypothetical protein [Solirubrobacteraceae bacterium]
MASGATEVHLAVMTDLSGHGVKYLNIPVSQQRYTPPKATPVVDAIATKSGTPIGPWAGRKQTTPASSTPVESRKVEPPKVEPPVEAPKVEPPKIEPPSEEPSSTKMIVGLDAG